MPKNMRTGVNVMHEHHQIADRLADHAKAEIALRFALLREWNNRAVGQYLRRVRERMDGAGACANADYRWKPANLAAGHAGGGSRHE